MLAFPYSFEPTTLEVPYDCRPTTLEFPEDSAIFFLKNSALSRTFEDFLDVGSSVDFGCVSLFAPMELPIEWVDAVELGTDPADAAKC